MTREPAQELRCTRPHAGELGDGLAVTTNGRFQDFRPWGKADLAAHLLDESLEGGGSEQRFRGGPPVMVHRVDEGFPKNLDFELEPGAAEMGMQRMDAGELHLWPAGCAAEIV